MSCSFAHLGLLFHFAKMHTQAYLGGVYLHLVTATVTAWSIEWCPQSCACQASAAVFDSRTSPSVRNFFLIGLVFWVFSENIQYILNQLSWSLLKYDFTMILPLSLTILLAGFVSCAHYFLLLSLISFFSRHATIIITMAANVLQELPIWHALN